MPSPTSAKYWSELKDLSDNVKLELHAPNLQLFHRDIIILFTLEFLYK
jgi:hypothetical protein